MVIPRTGSLSLYLKYVYFPNDTWCGMAGWIRILSYIPVYVVHDVLVHLLLALRGGLVLRVRARVDDAVHVDIEVVELKREGWQTGTARETRQAKVARQQWVSMGDEDGTSKRVSHLHRLPSPRKKVIYPGLM